MKWSSGLTFGERAAPLPPRAPANDDRMMSKHIVLHRWLLVGLLLIWTTRCHEAPSRSEAHDEPSISEQEPSSTVSDPDDDNDQLADGTYACEATNDTGSTYTLDCTVSGDSLTVAFPNGGTMDGTIETDGGPPFEGSASDSRSNSWTIAIDDQSIQ